MPEHGLHVGAKYVQFNNQFAHKPLLTPLLTTEKETLH